jgi:hypothetical protein
VHHTTWGTHHITCRHARDTQQGEQQGRHSGDTQQGEQCVDMVVATRGCRGNISSMGCDAGRERNTVQRKHVCFDASLPVAETSQRNSHCGSRSLRHTSQGALQDTTEQQLRKHTPSPPKASPMHWWPMHTPNRGKSGPSSFTACRQMPESAGAPADTHRHRTAAA